MKTVNWVLVSQLDGKPVSVSDEVHTKAGESHIIADIGYPAHEASSGRVYTSAGKAGYFPAVFQLAFIAIEETI